MQQGRGPGWAGAGAQALGFARRCAPVPSDARSIGPLDVLENEEHGHRRALGRDEIDPGGAKLIAQDQRIKPRIGTRIVVVARRICHAEKLVKMLVRKKLVRKLVEKLVRKNKKLVKKMLYHQTVIF